MKSILLSQGKVAMIDDEDFEFVSQWKWSYSSAKDGCERAIRKNGKTTLYLHREIMRALKGQEVDHKDRNGLNNLRENLRIATRSQNAANRRRQSNNTSGFIGVFRNKNCPRRPWLAYTKKDGIRINIARFATIEEAVAARDAACEQLHKEFASLNGYSLA